MKIAILKLLFLMLACSTYAEPVDSGEGNGTPPNEFERSYDCCPEGAVRVGCCAKPHLDAPYYCFAYAGNVYMEVLGSPESFVGKDYDELCSALSDSGCDLAGVSGYGDKFQEYSTIRSTAAFFYSANGKSYVLCGELSNLIILVPELDIQNSIINFVQIIDEKINTNVEINDNLEQQALAIFKKIFPYRITDDLPDGWHLGTVGEIVEIHDAKRVPLSGATRDQMKNKIYPYYGAASLMDYVDEYIFDGKFLLLGEDGTVIDDNGYPILQYVWGKFWVNNHAHILTGKNGFTVESLLLLFRKMSVKSIVTGAVQPKISQTNLRSIQLVIPPASLLNDFNILIDPIFSQIRLLQEENKHLSTLRDTLLPRLMSGELDVSDLDI